MLKLLFTHGQVYDVQLGLVIADALRDRFR
jgi:hypothetical protein